GTEEVVMGSARAVGSSTCSWSGRAPGAEHAVACRAFLKKRLAASASRVGLKRNSRVFPSESTARYRYVHVPLILMYVSSTLQESLHAFRRGRERLSSSGAEC